VLEIVARAMTSYPLTEQQCGMFEVRSRPLCILSSQEIDDLKRLFTRIKAVRAETFQIALERLNFGMERRLKTDRFLDYMIGLEALYVPDGTNEVTFRLSLRVAFTVAQGKRERKETFRFMKRMYGQRSNIAHGNKMKKAIKDEEILRVEGILWRSLQIYLENENMFTFDKIEDGEVKKEGVLDTIYFEQEFLHFFLVQDILEAGLVGDRERARASGKSLLQQLENDEELSAEERLRVISDLRRSLEHHPVEVKGQTDRPAAVDGQG
jgi:hypothetical protein